MYCSFHVCHSLTNLHRYTQVLVCKTYSLTQSRRHFLNKSWIRPTLSLSLVLQAFLTMFMIPQGKSSKFSIQIISRNGSICWEMFLFGSQPYIEKMFIVWKCQVILGRNSKALPLRVLRKAL